MPNQYFVSADMEGVCGVTHPSQCYPDSSNDSAYKAAVSQLATELRLVTQAIFAHQPDARIVINDAHNAMTNFHYEHIHPEVHFISGKPKKCAMLAGLDNSFQGIIFLGYHAKAGTLNGVLNHSFHSRVANIQVNGVSLGEAGINAYYASLVHRVPVILGVGDQAFCDEFAALQPSCPTISTKTGLSTTAAVCKAANQVITDFEAAMSKTMQQQHQWSSWLLDMPAPYQLELTLTTTLAADLIDLNPSFDRLDGCKVGLTCRDFETLYLALQTAYTSLNTLTSPLF